MENKTVDTSETIRILYKEFKKEGIPIKETKMYKTLSNMNLSEQDFNDYSNSLHNYLKICGVEATREKIVLVFRINPLAAIRMVETCSMVDDIDNIAYLFKPFYLSLSQKEYYNNDDWILNENRFAYMTLLIEAAFQSSVYETHGMGYPYSFLSYVQRADAKRKKDKNIPAKYLNSYNIKHMLKNIPENRQIELLNWFWDQHCSIVSNYNKESTFVGGRTNILINELPDGALWRHLENAEKTELSDREKQYVEKEREEIKRFIQNVFWEGQHLQYAKKILGEQHFYEKLEVLMGEEFSKNFERKCEVTI